MNYVVTINLKVKILDKMNELNCFEDDTNNHFRTIIHIDLDCFYAQIEMLKDPSLYTKPLGIQQKNLLVTCNYVAREHGLKKCMPLNEAIKMCPGLVVVNGEDLYDYRKASYQVTSYLQQYSALTERLGLDENFVDVTNMVKDRLCRNNLIKLVGHVFKDADEYCSCGCRNRLIIGSNIAQEIREGIRKELGLTSCAGIAHNKLLAKLVGSFHKPDQQTTVFPKNALNVILSYDILQIPGIGYATIEILNGLNIHTIEDLQKSDFKTLMCGFTPDKANYLLDLSFGKDTTPVKPSGRPLSIGLEDSYKSVSVEAEVEEKFSRLLNRLLLLVSDDGRVPTTIKITVRKLDNIHITGHRETRQCNISANLFSIDKITSVISLKPKSEKKLLSVIMNLFRKLVGNSKSFRITLLGLSFTKFLERVVGKKSIASYFMKDIAVQSVTNIENISHLRNVATTSGKNCDSSDNSETEIEQSSKKLKCSSFLMDPHNGCVSNCEYSSPSKLRVADLCLNSEDYVSCPPNATEDVFRELPIDVQHELWENWKRENHREDICVPTKKTKTNTILNYFVKNC